jgi:hypothetical protein
MKSPLLRVLPVFFAIFFVAACATEAIHKVDKVNYGYYSKTPLTMEKVRNTIERTATRNGWQLSQQKDGFFVGKREWGGGKHNIVIDVIYDVRAFSIKYRDSYQMKYDGSWIHNSYNRMVQKLEDDIVASVTAL